MYKKKPYLIHGSHSPCHRKMYIRLLVQYHPRPIWPSVPPLNLTYFDISPATVISEPALYRLLTFHVPNRMSIFHSLGHLFKESVQVRGPFWHFVRNFFFLRWGVVRPTPNSQAGGPPLVGCLRLLIQYIRSYPPYLEAISSIRNLRTRHAVVTRDPLNMAIDGLSILNLQQCLIRHLFKRCVLANCSDMFLLNLFKLVFGNVMCFSGILNLLF
jgi:hypothetical protein